MTIQTSLQLFTIKDQLDADLEGSLAAVAARGFTAVEPYDFVRRAAPLAEALTAAGLTAPSGHAFLASESFVNPDGSGTTVPVPSPAEVFAAAKVLGMTTVIDPYTAAGALDLGRPDRGDRAPAQRGRCRRSHRRRASGLPQPRARAGGRVRRRHRPRGARGTARRARRARGRPVLGRPRRRRPGRPARAPRQPRDRGARQGRHARPGARERVSALPIRCPRAKAPCRSSRRSPRHPHSNSRSSSSITTRATCSTRSSAAGSTSTRRSRADGRRHRSRRRRHHRRGEHQRPVSDPAHHLPGCARPRGRRRDRGAREGAGGEVRGAARPAASTSCSTIRRSTSS